MSRLGLTTAALTAAAASSEQQDEGCETPAGGGDTGGLLYIEQFSRRPGVELGQFRSMVAAATGSWDPDEAADQMLLTAGRSWYVARSLLPSAVKLTSVLSSGCRRLGPEPEYMTLWYSPNHGLNRLDEWDAAFRAGGEDEHVAKFRIVARIEQAGCYQPLLPPVPTRNGVYMVSAPAFRPEPACDD